MKFNSQICTTKEQSERLLALGLKKKTADMGWVKQLTDDGYVMAIAEDYAFIDIPAWSLHRLLKMLDERVLFEREYFKLYLTDDRCYFGKWYDYNRVRILHSEDSYNPFECLIKMTEWLIKEGYFNQEYLE